MNSEQKEVPFSYVLNKMACTYEEIEKNFSKSISITFLIVIFKLIYNEIKNYSKEINTSE